MRARAPVARVTDRAPCMVMLRHTHALRRSASFLAQKQKRPWWAPTTHLRQRCARAHAQVARLLPASLHPGLERGAGPPQR